MMFKNKYGFLPILSVAVTVLGLASAIAAGPAMPKYVLDMTTKVTVHEEQTERGDIYTVVLPSNSSYRVKPAIDDGLKTVEGFAKDNPEALLVINGGYFDPANKETASYVTLDRKEVLDPTTNERLTGNKGLAKYLPKIFNRSEFRVYECEIDGVESTRYDITSHDSVVPEACELMDALGAGPQLLPKLTALEEAVIDYNAQKRLIRDPFGINRPNARTAVGITADNSVVFLLLAQNPDREEASGFNYQQMTEALKKLGAVKAMALDGGSSSSMVVNSQSYWAKYNKSGDPVKRPVKSVLMITP